MTVHFPHVEMSQRDWSDGKTASLLHPYWTYSPWPIPALLRMSGPACLNSYRAGLHPRSTTVYLQLSPRLEVPLQIEDFRDSTPAEQFSHAEFPMKTARIQAEALRSRGR